jgi:hypothetical protein
MFSCARVCHDQASTGNYLGGVGREPSPEFVTFASWRISRFRDDQGIDAPGYQTKTSRLRRYPYGEESVQGCLGFEPVSAHSASWGSDACRFQSRTRISGQQSERYCVRAAAEPRRRRAASPTTHD